MAGRKIDLKENLGVFFQGITQAFKSPSSKLADIAQPLKNNNDIPVSAARQMGDVRPDVLKWAHDEALKRLAKDSADIDEEEEESADKSCWGVWKRDHYVRQFLYKFTKSNYFQAGVAAAVIYNCVLVAGLESVDDGMVVPITVISTVFALETLCVSICHGFRKYLCSSWWNRLDFVAVGCTYLDFLATPGSSFKAVTRIFRLLRVLRIIHIVPDVKILTYALVASISHIFEVMVLILFLILIFGLTGTAIFRGVLQNFCISISTGVASEQVCSVIANTGHTCSEGEICAHAANPNFSITNFDHILSSWLTVFQCMTLEGWSDIMYAIIGAGFPLSPFYFIALIFVGSFFGMNLVTAVIVLRFEYATYIHIFIHLCTLTSCVQVSPVTRTSQVSCHSTSGTGSAFELFCAGQEYVPFTFQAPGTSPAFA
jgi:hypothetical protein